MSTYMKMKQRRKRTSVLRMVSGRETWELGSPWNKKFTLEIRSQGHPVRVHTFSDLSTLTPDVLPSHSFRHRDRFPFCGSTGKSITVKWSHTCVYYEKFEITSNTKYQLKVKLESRSVDIIEKDIFASYLSHGSENLHDQISYRVPGNIPSLWPIL